MSYISTLLLSVPSLFPLDRYRKDKRQRDTAGNMTNSLTVKTYS